MIITFKRSIHRMVPRALVNFAWNLASDAKDLPARLRDPRPRPWRCRHNVGGGDFYAAGERLFETVCRAGGMKATDHVLDIGCGAGRLAVPMCAFLDETGAYTGFDIARSGLAFAGRTAEGRCAIRFVHANLANREYGRRGDNPAAYRFPVGEACIDLAVATSVLTHVEPDVAKCYLEEAGRVLKPGGRLVLTAFYVDEAGRAALASGRARLKLASYAPDAWVADPRNPERAIGFTAERFLHWARAAGLDLARPVEPGDWRDPAPSGEFQDILVLEKA